MARRPRRIIDYADRTVRLTDERLGHIREHPEMVGQERRVREVLQAPDVVFPSHKTLQFMYSSATMRAVRLGQSI